MTGAASGLGEGTARALAAAGAKVTLLDLKEDALKAVADEIGLYDFVRQGGDILTGMWLLLSQLGAVTRKLVWDREAAIGPKGTPTALAAGFVGTLGTRLELAPPRDPEYKGMVIESVRLLEKRGGKSGDYQADS